MLLLEHRSQIVLDIIDHVLVAGGDDVERHGLLCRHRQAQSERRQRGK